MIICTTQPIENYSIDHSYGFKVGIGQIFETNPLLFSLISVMSPVFYQWEEGSPVPVEERSSSFTMEMNNLYVRTLSSDVGGLSISQWLKILNTPSELYIILNQFTLSGLPILDFYTVDQLRLIMRARCRSWILSNKRDDLSNLLSIFTKEDEDVVKQNAYGKYYVSKIH